MKYKVQIKRLDADLADDSNYETDSMPTHEELCRRVLQPTGGWFVISVTGATRERGRHSHVHYFAHVKPRLHRDSSVVLYEVGAESTYSEKRGTVFVITRPDPNASSDNCQPPVQVPGICGENTS